MLQQIAAKTDEATGQGEDIRIGIGQINPKLATLSFRPIRIEVTYHRQASVVIFFELIEVPFVIGAGRIDGLMNLHINKAEKQRLLQENTQGMQAVKIHPDWVRSRVIVEPLDLIAPDGFIYLIVAVLADSGLTESIIFRKTVECQNPVNFIPGKEIVHDGVPMVGNSGGDNGE